MSARPLPDLADRVRAATEFDRNVVVVAGAGTGKTSLLVERILVAVGAGIARVTDLAAITFTEKAAAEMRTRFASALERLRRAAGGGEPPDPGEAWGRAVRHLVEERGVPGEEVESRAIAALAELDRARITTIHSFCADLLRSHPLEAGADPGFGVDQGPVFRELLAERWEEFLLGELGPRAARAELWRRLLGRVPIGILAELARSLASFAVPEALLGEPGAGAAPVALLGPEASDLLGRLDSILTRQTGMGPAAVAKLEFYREALRLFVREGVPALRRLVEEGRGDAGDAVPAAPKPGRRLRGVDPAELESVTRDAVTLIRGLAAVDEGVCRDLVEAVGPFALDARRALLARGVVDFDGLLVLTRNLLRDRPEVREHVRSGLRMLLVDEFQDTDPLQYEIVLYLAGRAGERASDAYDVPLDPGRLFIVGDPKQSIYRFRGADYTAFERAVRRVEEEGGVTLHLTANFRSARAVIEPLNALFLERWRGSRFQPEYVPIEAASEDDPPGPRIELWTVPASGRADERREAEGEAIAARIGRLIDEEGVEPRDVMLLLRAFTNLPYYLRPLREAGIPFVVDGGRAFLERAEVVQLLAVLRALARPSDPAALLGFLRSPAGAVSDRELASWAAGGGAWRASESPDPAGFPALARSLALLRSLAAEVSHLPADSVVRRVLHRSGLLPLGAFAYEGAQRVANLAKLASLAHELARDGTLSLNEVLDALEEARTGEPEGDSPLADEGASAVRVLSIHKAKGLESRVVLVGDLAREEGHLGGDETAAARVLRVDDRTAVLALRGADLRNAAWIRRERDERKHEEAEGLRTLYVALTRAKERLILFAARPRNRAPWVDALASWSYFPAVPPGDGDLLQDGGVVHRIAAPPAGGGRAEEPLAGEPQAVAAWLEATRIHRDRSRPALARPSGEMEVRDAAREREEEGGFARADDPARSVSRAAGIAVHEALERWEPAAEARPEVAAPAARAAVEAGADRSEVEREASEIVRAFLASPLVERLRAARILGREVPLLLRRDDGGVSSGKLDLLFREPDGSLVVADYKTDRDLDAAEAARRYAPQLVTYAEAVRRALHLDLSPRAEIWLLREGRIVVIGSEARHADRRS